MAYLYLICELYCLFYSIIINYLPVHIIRHTILMIYYYYIFISRFFNVLHFILYYLFIYLFTIMNIIRNKINSIQ